MALTNYGELKTAVAAWLARADLSSTLIPDFITLTHKQLLRDLRGDLRMQVRASYTIDSEYKAVPLDFIEVVSFQIPGNPPYALKLIPDDSAANYNGASGQPRYFSMVGSVGNAPQFRFSPSPGGSYAAVLDYYATLTDFALDADTNWILDDFPQLYLWGACYHGHVYLKDPQSAGQMKMLYDDEMARVKLAGSKQRWGGNGMQIRPA